LVSFSLSFLLIFKGPRQLERGPPGLPFRREGEREQQPAGVNLSKYVDSPSLSEFQQWTSTVHIEREGVCDYLVGNIRVWGQQNVEGVLSPFCFCHFPFSHL
jgi:hypothetical protein